MTAQASPGAARAAEPVADQRADLLTAGGPLRASMLALERRPLVAEFMREAWLWVHWLRITRGLSARTTCARYAEVLGRFGEWLVVTHRDWRALDLADLDEWQKALFVDRRNSAGWRRVQLQAVRSFYGFRKLRGLGPDISEGMRGPRKLHKTPRKYSRAELRAIFAAVEPSAHTKPHATRDRAMLLLLYATGARRDELATLRLDQLEVAERVAVVRFLGKGAKEREVPMEGPAVRQLTEWLVLRGNLSGIHTDRVFVSIGTRTAGAGLSAGSVERIVKRCAKHAELATWGVHRWRVTFATHLYDDGHDLERIRILMGHETIETTRRYVAVSERMRRVRLRSSRQHDVLGTVPENLPRWAKQLEEKRNA